MPYLFTKPISSDPATQLPETRSYERMLAEALEEVLVVAGMISAGNELTGPQLLNAANDYCASLRSTTGIVNDRTD